MADPTHATSGRFGDGWIAGGRPEPALTKPLLPRPIVILLVVLVVVRTGAMTRSAITHIRGDFYASMPGAYVERVNPALWNSPDMAGAWGYHQDTYFHGPTQYLTLYPLAYFDSFAAIAAFMLPLLAVILAITFWLMWRAARRLGAGNDLFVPLLASTFLFFPLLQAYLQREFEVILTCALAGALLALLADRRSTAAALLAYAAWFKYIPLLFTGYFVVRRWMAAVLVFAGTSAALLAVSHWVFGLPRFFNNNVPGHAAQVFAVFDYGFARDPTQHLYGTGFCNGWFDNESTLANIRHGLCSIAAYHPWLNPALAYLVLCAAVAIVYIHTHVRLERSTVAPAVESRRRAIEFAIITTICSCFFFSHYYYLVALIIPFNVLLIVFLVDRRWLPLTLWGIAYVLVSAFLVPIGILSRVAGYDVWEPYIWQAWFLYGELLLVGLLMHEYRRLPA